MSCQQDDKCQLKKSHYSDKIMGSYRSRYYPAPQTELNVSLNPSAKQC